ncbi:MAG TPA: twin-arginine translocation signal domain-containing protein [Solirubrobacteraceae bacterium]|nr:twin-arginine translocation signal domain-containing protein [Solirubrobacteraceae bacterium]
MSALTRRGFVKKSAVAAAGMTAVGTIVAEQADADAVAGAEPVVAYVSNPKKGEISVMAGDREVTVRDRKLAASIVRAGR